MKPKHKTSPKYAQKFLRFFLKEELVEEVLGDLEEKFYQQLQQYSYRKCKRNYWFQVFNYLRPFAIKNNVLTHLNPFFMFRHNFLVAIRSLKRNSFTFLINTISLALGITCCLLIGLYIKDELSYDQQHPDVENLYRVFLDINMNEWESNGTAIPPILSKKLVEEIPEIKNAARLNPYFGNAGTNLVRTENEKQNQFEEKFVYADPSFFELFYLPLVYGDQENILNQPKQMLISQRIADKYFPHQNPVGQTLILNDNAESTFLITGVLQNNSHKAHFDYDFYMSMKTLEDSETNTNWLFNNYYAYVSLKDGTDPAQLQSKLRAFTLRNFGPQFKEQQNIDLEAIQKKGQHYWVDLQAVSDIHLHSASYGPQLKANGDINNLRLFGAIALFILLIAIVNFVNLSTARSANRAQEVGLRKVLGSMRKDLVSQFMSEAVLISFFAFVVGILLTNGLLPFFNQLSGKELVIPFSNIYFLLILLSAPIVIGIIAGLYPSLYLSAFRPAKVLKGKLSRGAKGSKLRGSLVVVQFAISVVLIVGSLVVYQQMSFIQNKKLGFEKEQVMLIQDTYTLENQLSSFKTALKKLPEVANATLSSYLPLDGGRRNSISFYREGKSKVQDQVLLQTWSTDTDYINTLGMKIKEGREFDKARSTDSLCVILNESAIRSFGLENPIGQKITSPYREEAYTVIGVLEDFNYGSLKGKVAPLGLFLGLSNSVISVKANASEMDQLISKTENLWKSFAPNLPFRYEFLDDRFARMYTVEKRIGKLFLIFTGLAIFIACLGLLALVSFMTEQRVKEIGIRKVLGASSFSIVKMLSTDFTKMVLLAIAIALPLSYYTAQNWLEGFAFRIDLQIWIFIIAGLSALLIAWLTVGFSALKAANRNPTESLKD